MTHPIACGDHRPDIKSGLCINMQREPITVGQRRRAFHTSVIINTTFCDMNNVRDSPGRCNYRISTGYVHSSVNRAIPGQQARNRLEHCRIILHQLDIEIRRVVRLFSPSNGVGSCKATRLVTSQARCG